MNDKRQKTKSPLQQQRLAFAMEGRDESPDGHCEGPVSRVADSCTQRPTSSDRLMESICDPATLDCALARVISNQGAPGIDGMKVSQLEKYFERHQGRITEELLSGRYRPQPVKRVEIPKPDGGVRKLGIPTAVDRVIQQAILLVLSPMWDETFSDNSFGFRPFRSAHDAVARAQSYLVDGYTWVVDMDLEKFFDRVTHDVLMGRVARRVDDKRLLKLIRAFLNSGVLMVCSAAPIKGCHKADRFRHCFRTFFWTNWIASLNLVVFVSLATPTTATCTSKVSGQANGFCKA